MVKRSSSSPRDAQGRSEDSAPGVLYVVATPLGNLEDLSSRAQRCLGQADCVYAEDTRHSRTLMQRVRAGLPSAPSDLSSESGLEPKTELRSLHEHNERPRTEEVIRRLAEGKHLALISDAGTPGVSDPGARLVSAVLDAGYPVVPVPGPSALAAAISISGFPIDEEGVWFVGFLPARGSGREQLVERLHRFVGVAVVFESPRRVRDLLSAMKAHNPERSVCMSRELTKVYEEVRRDTVQGLLANLEPEVKGEVTLVFGPRRVPVEPPDEVRIQGALRRCVEAGLSMRDAVALMTDLTGESKKKVYRLGCELKSERPS